MGIFKGPVFFGTKFTGIVLIFFVNTRRVGKIEDPIRRNNIQGVVLSARYTDKKGRQNLL